MDLRGVEAVGRLGREVGRLVQDRFAPGTMPRRVDQLDAAFLGRVLGLPLATVEVLTATDGTTDRARVGLAGEGAPGSVFVKMAPSAAVTRLFVNLSDLGADEIGFYRDVRPMLALEAPAPLGFEIDAASKRFVLVLEDLAARGCTFGEVLAPLDPAAAGAVLDTLAALHGTCWQSPLLDRLGWIRANSSDVMMPLVSMAVRAMGSRLVRRDPALVPPAGRAILGAYPSVARQLDAGSHTVLHGDPHPGNCYFVDGRAGLLDWQVIRRGNPLRDVGYFLVLALDPESRRRHERSLLERYREALSAAGGPSLTADEAWTSYRRMAAYPYVASTFTAGLGGLQDDAVGLEGLRRAVIAIDDLDTAAGLGLEVRTSRARPR